MIVQAFLGRTIFTSLLLGYAARSDLSKREVENWVPGGLVIGGLAFALYDWLATGDELSPLLALVSAGIGFAIALAVFHLGSLGGADCKILIGVSAVFPLVLGSSSPFPSLQEVNPLSGSGGRLLPMFSVSWLVNSLLVSLVLPIALFLRNMFDYSRGRIPEVGRKTIPAFFVGYRTKVSNLRPSFLIPLERFEDVEGRTVKVLRYSRRILQEEEERKVIDKVRQHLGGDDSIWAFPYVPFIVPMLAGFLVTILFGDLLVNVIFAL